MSENIEMSSINTNNRIEQENKALSDRKKDFVAWVKSHKKQLIAAGVGVIALIVIIMSVKNVDELKTLWLSLQKNIKKNSDKPMPVLHSTLLENSVVEIVETTKTYTLPSEEFDVSRHIRTMAIGRRHSPEKAAEAAALGIELLPNQTLVDAYKKYVA